MQSQANAAWGEDMLRAPAPSLAVHPENFQQGQGASGLGAGGVMEAATVPRTPAPSAVAAPARTLLNESVPAETQGADLELPRGVVMGSEGSQAHPQAEHEDVMVRFSSTSI